MTSCSLDLDCKTTSVLCYGTFPMKETTYLYHGSSILFKSPYELNQIDNRLSPSPNIPALFATKLNGFGFIYEYKGTDKTLKIGGIPNLLFACGKFSTIQSKLEEELDNLCKTHGCFKKIEDDYQRLNYSGYDSIIKKICYTPYNGLFIPGYENQLVLCRNKGFLQINNIYFITRYLSNKYFNFKIIPLWKNNKIMPTIDILYNLKEFYPLSLDILDNKLTYIFEFLFNKKIICEKLTKYSNVKEAFKSLLTELSDKQKKIIIKKFTDIITDYFNSYISPVLNF